MPYALAQFLRTFIRLVIIFGILYLIFTNFGTFLIILLVIFSLGYYFVYQLKKKLRQGQGNHFKFTFNGQDFRQENQQGFNFKDFENFQQQFRQGGFSHPSSLSELQDAKDFFGFTSEPTKEEIKKKYKLLARKYHPDINDHDDTMMKKLNHYKDILLKAYGQ